MKYGDPSKDVAPALREYIDACVAISRLATCVVECRSIPSPRKNHRLPNPNRSDLSELFLFPFGEFPPPTALPSAFSVLAANKFVEEVDVDPSLDNEIFGNVPNAIPMRNGVVLPPSLVVVDPDGG